MNWKTWFPLMLAIVLGVVAAKKAHDWVQKNKAAIMPAGHFTKVVVAKGDVSPGKELAADDLILSQVQADAVPSNSFKTVEEVVGRVNEIAMVKGQPILESMLAATGSGSGLQALVPEGMRAVTMEVNEFSGIAGLITPGCHVDIITTINGGENGGQVARTIVQNVKITAVGQHTAAAAADAPPAPSEMFKSVTVLCKLEEAEAIELACSTGRPRLVLRGGRDKEIVASAGISLSELRGNKDEKPIEPLTVTLPPTTMQSEEGPTTKPSEVALKEAPRRVVKVIRGGSESTVTLDVLDGVPPTATSDTESSDPFDSN